MAVTLRSVGAAWHNGFQIEALFALNCKEVHVAIGVWEVRVDRDCETGPEERLVQVQLQEGAPRLSVVLTQPATDVGVCIIR
ncbi:hypothetical protein BIU92_14005 [Curtobacterium sp. MCBA15_003]|nr:hypothetical protein BIU92_14005 [Curtobacterium sp. MCBA15_003]OII32562.1 hypothetical protein BIU94_04470 [Curtobacterium sp. MMLR14_006]